jgi:hypothetical protein
MMKPFLIKITIIIFISFIFRFSSAYAQFYSNHELSLDQIKKDIKSNFVLLSLAYEPGLEDGSTLSYYRYQGVKTYSVFFTRGEGSENANGTERYQELGSIKTKESQAASKILGCDNYFLNFFDNGEFNDLKVRFKKWGGKDTIVSRLVFLIRLLKPDVIFYGNIESGNGCSIYNHLIDSLLPDAINKASEHDYKIPNVLNKYNEAWKVKRIFKRTNNNISRKNDICLIPNNEINKEINKSILEISGSALSKYTSISERDREQLFEHQKNISYELVNNREKAGKKSKIKGFFDNLENRFENSDRFFKILNLLLNRNFKERDSILELSSHIDRLSDLMKREMVDKRKYDPLEDRILTNIKFKINDLKVNILGIKVEKSFSDSAVCQRQVCLLQFDTIYNLPPGKTSIFFLNMNKDWVILRGSEFNNNMKMKYKEKIQIVLPEKMPLTFPGYIHQYESMNLDYPLKYVLIHESTESKYCFQYFDYEKFDVVPKSVLEVLPKTVKINKNRLFDYSLTHYLNDPVKNVNPKISNVEMGTSVSDTFNLNNKYDSKSGKILFTLADSVKYGTHALFFTVGKPIYSRVIAKKFQCRVDSGAYIGIISHGKTELEKFMKDMEIRYDFIMDLNLESLSKYSSIIIDEDVMNYRNDLENNERINEYVKNGGRLVILSQNIGMFFHKKSVNILNKNIILSDKMVFNESAKVSFLKSEHSLFKFPNNINIIDWKDWIQDRGKYFPKEYPEDMKELISITPEAGEEIKSGILYGEDGKGSVIYTALSINRQLFSVVEGAYRIFANMISKSKNN